MPWDNQLNNKWIFGIKQVIHISSREMCHSLVLLCMSWTCVKKKAIVPANHKLSVLNTIAFWIVQSLTHIFLALFGKEWKSSLGALTLHKLTSVLSEPTWACSFHADNLSYRHCLQVENEDMMTCIPLQMVDVQMKYAPLFACKKWNCRQEDLLPVSTNSGGR